MTRAGSAPVRPRIDGPALAAVFLGGCVGTGLRAAVALSVPTPTGSWPWATLAVNLVGALVLGRIVRALRSGRLGPRAGQVLGTGFAGSLTTFSAFAVEALLLAESQGAAAALLYTGVSVTLGLAAAATGLRE